MAEKIFQDSKSIERTDDTLQVLNLSTKEVLLRLFHEYVWPRKKLLLWSGLAMLVSGATTSALPFLMQQAADEVFVSHNTTVMVVLPLLVILLVGMKSGSEYLSSVGQAYIGNRIVADMRVEMFSKLATADLAWIQRTHSGRFVASFMNDVGAIREAAGMTVVAIGQNLVKVILLTGAMFYMDWRLSLIAIITMPLAVRMMGRKRQKMFTAATKMFQETGDLGHLITQTLSGIRVVKAYDREVKETARAKETIDRTAEFIMRSVRARASSGPLAEFLTGIGFALAILYAGYQGVQGNLTTGHFMGFVTAAMLMYPPLKGLAALQTVLQLGVAAANRVFGILDVDASIKEKPGAKPLNISGGDIRFDDVDFHYRDGEPVLEGFNLHVPAGKRVALVGPSGVGKSTVINLLLRFYDPQSGSITIDGQKVADATIASVRQAAALVTQEPVLFDDTIRGNITYGSEDATDEAVEEAARAAVAHEFIMSFPHGYNTQVGESGSTLSGGQRQRVAFARAMLRGSPILLLDEPTSSLDSESEAKLQVALDELLKGRTVIMIAHRLSTVQKADVIHVMDHGRIVESGTHKELIARNGAYARLHRSQFDAIDEEPQLIAGE